MSVSAVNPNAALSNRRSCGPQLFHASQPAQNIVSHSRNRGVPMNRAIDSEMRPNVSGEKRGRGSSVVRCSRGWSRRSATAGLLLGLHGPVGLVLVRLAPVLGQEVVQDVVD